MLHARLTSFIFTRRIVNDTYRTDLCLLYPPFMIALGKIHPPHLLSLLFKGPVCNISRDLLDFVVVTLTDTTHTGSYNIVSGLE